MIPRHTPDTCESLGDTPPGPDELDRLRSCRVFIEIYGCRYNFGDTAKLVEILKGQDCTFAGCPDIGFLTAGGGVRHAPVIMSDLSAAALPGMTHGTADCINCLTGDEALEPGDFPAGQFVREPVAGEDKAQDAMAFDEKPGNCLPVSVRATPRYGVWWR